MSGPARPPFTLYKHITDFIDRQNGSQTQKQLLPAIAEHVSTAKRMPQTVDSILTIIHKSQDDMRRFRLEVHRWKTGEAEWTTLQKTLENKRLTVARRAAIEMANARIIRAHDKRSGKSAPKLDKRGIAEERLVKALNELKEKNVQWAAQAERDAEEEKQRKREQKREEKKEREEKKAADKEVKKQADQEKRNREAELRARQTDLRAMQSLDAKAQQVKLEKDKKEEAERRKTIDNLMITALKIFIDPQQGTKGRKRQRREEPVVSDSDKENIEPE
jgi:DNA polymerase III gamma/tau subunit